MLFAEHLSPQNVRKLFDEQHFANVTSKMSELGKAFLCLHLSVVTNAPIIEKLVEQMLSASKRPKANLSKEIVSHLELVVKAFLCLQGHVIIAKQDLYLLFCHPNVGNTLYHHFQKEAGLQMMDLKVDDPNIEKTAREVEAAKKEVSSSNKKNNHNTQDRGHGHAPSSKHYTGRDTVVHMTNMVAVVSAIVNTLPMEEVPTTITIVTVTMTIVAIVTDIILEISMEIFRIITPVIAMLVRDSKMDRIIPRLEC